MKTNGPNHNTPQAEHIGEEIAGDAAIGGSSDDEYEPIVTDDIEDVGREDEPLD